MYYAEYGSRGNPTVVLLHPAGLVDAYVDLYDLSEDYHLVIPHMYGSGREVSKSYHYKEVEAEIIKIIKGLNKEKVILIGHSLGACLCVTLLCKIPEFIEKAFISSPWVVPSNEVNRKWAKGISKISGLIKTKIVARLILKLLKYPKEQRDFFMDTWPKMLKENIPRWYSQVPLQSNCIRIANNRVPITLVYAEKDIKSMRDSVSWIKEIRSDCKVKYLAGMGHDNPITNKGTFRKNIEEFLKL
ncbi:alpha/beta fold hydrolase [Alkaliphilus peptidifermentans]|uniref:Pimeloyl-ACP methyl ester carboxylesterase n=1 Tax=Alkaliphilus peptidifermentans DSM 18978 TaxID=1120976 RepID=A0A1G5EUA0_9FIRM|nr:alpha/beta hydrolase [Alkaliphilus peptidifermentans]SCY30543.1 Pimeloyl-ACP methyl ester carboxylesterase [Alkaliphilus peptidifermentans DSM 18978]